VTDPAPNLRISGTAADARAGGSARGSGHGSGHGPDAADVFAILVREQSERLLAYLRASVPASSVDDIFQETVLVAWRRLGDYDRSRPFGAWMRGIARNMVLDFWSRAGRERPTDDALLEKYLDKGQLGQEELTAFRRKHLGFVFQSFNLLPKLNVVQNVELPMIYAGLGGRERRERAIKALEMVDLGNRLKNRPSQLSGGQQQRVAIARALVNNPRIILADEPTGNLDTRTGQEVIELLASLQRDHGCTILTATHDVKMLKISDRIAWIRDGKLDRLETRDTIRFGTVTDKLDGKK
jgi:putative ABC transport system ATP-binding protein